jgi:hypothetical protein
MQRAKESAADIMRQKQAAGSCRPLSPFQAANAQATNRRRTAEAKKAAEAAKK